MELNYDRIWGRKILLDVVDQSNIPYRLIYGTILGSLRHNGFIDNDVDSDVPLLLDKKDKGIDLKNYNLYNKSFIEIRKIICNILKETANKLYPEYIFDIHIGAYQEDRELGYVLGKDNIDWNIKGYGCTITIWDKKDSERLKIRGKNLNYPHVLDLDIKYTDEFNKIHGPECISYVYDLPYSGFEGVHKYLMATYGESYMIAQSVSIDENGKRQYSKGKNKNDKIAKELRKKCRGEYTKKLENKIRESYGKK